MGDKAKSDKSAAAAGPGDGRAAPIPIERSGTVALVGRSNVGKSTLLNAALQTPLAIVSRTPQTTRDHLLGVVRHGGAEIGLIDTPGLHRARTRLGKEMNRSARFAARDADVLVFVIALPPRPGAELRPHPGDLSLLDELPAETPTILVINKIDLLKDKTLLLPFIQAFASHREFVTVVPISALRDNGVSRVLDEAARLLPLGGQQHEEDALTDRPLRYFAAEYVREPVFRATSEEVPHAVAVTVDEMIEMGEGRAACISVTIHVERQGQKGILIGKQGAMLKKIGSTARKRIEQLLGQRVHLELFVRVTENWRQRPEMLADFGLIAGGGS